MGFFHQLKKIVGYIKERGTEKVNDGFAAIAGIVYDHPYWSIGITLFVTAISGIGFLPGVARWTDGAENLYALPYSLAKTHGAIRRNLFSDTNSRATFVVVTAQEEGDSVFTWEHLEKLRQLDRLVRGQIVDPAKGRRVAISRANNVAHASKAILPVGGPAASEVAAELYNASAVDRAGVPERLAKLVDKVNNNAQEAHPEENRGDASLDVLTFQDICARDAYRDCTVTGVLEMGIFDIKDSLPPGSPPILYLFDGLVFNTRKKGFNPLFSIGGVKEVPCTPELPKSLLLLFYTEDKLMEGSNDAMARANLTCITDAKALSMVYEVEDSPEYTSRNEDWEKVLVEILLDNRDFGNLRVNVNAYRSRDDALRSSTSESSDILFVGLTIALLFTYSTSLNFSCDLYRSKSYPAVAGLLAAVLGLAAGLGYMSIIGFSFVPTALVCPFLVVGVGTDDMFVIINCYVLGYMVQSSKERCVEALRETGISITITTLTSLTSFGIGMTSEYLSIRNFCVFCAAGLLFGYLFVFSFFFATLCLDARREEANRVCLFCLPKETETEKRLEELKRQGIELQHDLSTLELVSKLVKRSARRREMQKRRAAQAREEAKLNGTATELSTTGSALKLILSKLAPSTWTMLSYGDTRSVGNKDVDAATPLRRHRKKKTSMTFDGSNLYGEDGDDDGEDDGFGSVYFAEPPGTVGRKWRIFLLEYYGPFLIHPVTKMMVILGFVGFFAISLWGFIHIESGLDLKDLSPAGHYLSEYDALYDEYFNEFDVPVDVFFPEPTEWWDPEYIQELESFGDKLMGSGAAKFVNNPLTQMAKDVDLRPRLLSGDRSTFETTLYEALSTFGGKYQQFQQHFVWEGPHLVAWKMQVLPAGMKSSKERAAWMKQIRRDCDEMTKTRKPLVVMAWNYMMTFYESDLQIMYMVVTNMSTAAGVMLIVAMVGIPQLSGGFLVVLVMILIDIGVFGFMYFWDIRLNMVSCINMLISIGFAIDYAAHVTHTYMDALGETRDLRVLECLLLMGNPVFHGAASTFLGVLMLGFSSSYIFRVFFKMMSLVVLFGISHSVVFLPVLLSLVGGSGPGHRKPAVDSRKVVDNSSSNSLATRELEIDSAYATADQKSRSDDQSEIRELDAKAMFGRMQDPQYLSTRDSVALSGSNGSNSHADSVSSIVRTMPDRGRPEHGRNYLRQAYLSTQGAEIDANMRNLSWNRTSGENQKRGVRSVSVSSATVSDVDREAFSVQSGPSKKRWGTYHIEAPPPCSSDKTVHCSKEQKWREDRHERRRITESVVAAESGSRLSRHYQSTGERERGAHPRRTSERDRVRTGRRPYEPYARREEGRFAYGHRQPTVDMTSPSTVEMGVENLEPPRYSHQRALHYPSYEKSKRTEFRRVPMPQAPAPYIDETAAIDETTGTEYSDGDITRDAYDDRSSSSNVRVLVVEDHGEDPCGPLKQDSAWATPSARLHKPRRRLSRSPSPPSAAAIHQLPVTNTSMRSQNPSTYDTFPCGRDSAVIGIRSENLYNVSVSPAADRYSSRVYESRSRTHGIYPVDYRHHQSRQEFTARVAQTHKRSVDEGP